MTSPVSELYPFGLLIKSWATGLNYFTQALSPDPLPTTPPTAPIPSDATWALPPLSGLFVPIAGSAAPASVKSVAMTWSTFAGILHNANNFTPMGAITNPTNATNVVIIQGDDSTLVLRLPSGLSIQRAEKALLDGTEAYDIPDFYDNLFKDPDDLTKPATQVMPKSASPADILQLQANRIGDYSMGNCN